MWERVVLYLFRPSFFLFFFSSSSHSPSSSSSPSSPASPGHGHVAQCACRPQAAGRGRARQGGVRATGGFVNIGATGGKEEIRNLEHMIITKLRLCCSFSSSLLLYHHYCCYCYLFIVFCRALISAAAPSRGFWRRPGAAARCVFGEGL